MNRLETGQTSQEARQAESRQPKFSVPMLMLVDNQRWWMAFMPLNTFEAALTDVMHFNRGPALDYWPIGLTRLQARIPGQAKKHANAIATITQSYREEKTLKKALQHENPALAAKSWLLLDHITEIGAIANVANATPRPVPVSIYPNTLGRLHEQRPIHGPKSWLTMPGRVYQPTEKQQHTLGIRTDWDQDRILVWQRLAGFNIDTTTCRYLFRNDDLEYMMQLIKRVDLSPCRDDFETPDVDTSGDLEPNSEFFQMFQQLLDLGFRGPYNIKVPLAKVENILGYKKPIKDPANMGTAYLNFIDLLLSNVVVPR